MTTVAELLRGEAGPGGPFISDPRDMDRSVVPNAYYSEGNALTSVDASGSTFWTNFANAAGAVVTSDWAANTYKTLVDTVGRGFLYWVLGPRLSVGSTSVTTIKITVDGVAFEIPVTRPSGYDGRQILGPLGQNLTTPITDYNPLRSEFLAPSAYAVPYAPQNGHIFRGDMPGVLNRNGSLKLGKVLKYSTDLKVEIKSSVAITSSSGTYNRNAAVLYDEAN